MPSLPAALRHPVLRVLLVALVYFVAARLCAMLPESGTLITPVWVPSGIAFASVLLIGRTALIGVFAGDVAASIVAGLGTATATGIAIGDTLEAAIAAWVFLRLGGDPALTRVRHVFFVVAAAIPATLVSASTGVILLDANGLLGPLDIDAAFQRYWTSTTTGIILVGPTILVWAKFRDRQRLDRVRTSHRRFGLRWVEGTLLAGTLLAITADVFVRGNDHDFAGLLLLFPLFLWATLRFGARGATTSVLTVAAVGTWGTVLDHVALSGLDVDGSVAVLQLLIAVVMVANLVLAVVIEERDRERASTQELLSVFGHAQQLVGVGSWQLRLRPHGAAAALGPTHVETGRLDLPPGLAEQIPSAAPEAVLAALGPKHADDADMFVWVSWELAELLELPGEPRFIQLAALLSCVDPPDLKRLLRAVRGTIVEGRPFSIEHKSRTPDGEKRTLRHVGTIADRDDPLGGRLVGAVLDISDQKQVELIKDALVATASHELRTPLTSILGFAQTLGGHWDEVPEKDRRRYLRIIEQQAKRLSSIVDDTLLQASVDNLTLAPSLTEVRLWEVVERALAAFPGLDVTSTVSSDVRVRADPEYLDRILVNLVSNADKYGKSPIEVDALVHEDEHEVELRVIDHGEGTTPEFADRMFDRFTRGSTTTDAPGTGLGLSIVRGMVESMDGTIEYERDADRTVLDVRLPTA